MMELWIAEKRGVAEKIAAAMGGGRAAANHIEMASGIVIAWCEGHLLRLANPEEIKPEWKVWSDEHLPMLPEQWNTVEHDLPRRRALLHGLGTLLKKASSVVIATDAGREGETIAREVLVHFRYRGPVQRFWGKAESPAGIRQALGELRPGADTIRLYYAGKARTIADWLVGLNATRLATHQAREALGGRGPLLSIGRVQSPTLALIVRRDRAIENFVPQAFWEVFAHARVQSGSVRLKVITPERITQQLIAEQIAAALKDAELTLRITTERKRKSPPKLFSLALLQQAANKRFRWSLKRTQEMAQSIKDKGYITYHRTDSVHLEDGQAADVPEMLRVIARIPALAGVASSLTPVIRKSVFDSSKVTDHAAITPTLDPPPLSQLSADELALYQLICARTLAGVSPDYVYDATRVEATHNGHIVRATGNKTVELGWRAVLDEPVTEAAAAGDADSDEDAPQELPALTDGAPAKADRIQVTEGATKPEARYTEGSLSQDMIGIAKYATHPDIKKRLRETSGIGRPSTHDSIIETLIDRHYVGRHGIQLISTALGRALVDALLPELVEPTLTALWEDQLLDIENGHGDPKAFVAQLKAYLPDLIGRMRNAPLKITEALVNQSTAPPPVKKGARSRSQTAPKGRSAKGSRQRASAPRAPTATTPVNAAANAGPRQSYVPRTGQPFRPSDRQIGYATELAREHGLTLPEGACDDASICSAFIDSVKAGKPSAQQLDRAHKLAQGRRISVPQSALTRADECAAFIKAQLAAGAR